MSKSVEKVSTQSKDIFTQELAKFSQIFPQFVSEGKVDFDALKKFLEDKNSLADEKDKYTFSWAGKDESFKAISRPSYATLNPKPDESVDFDNTENLFIEGDNLEVLKLLQTHYHGKIKMIYIDPPYNTGNDFIYKDNFKEGKSDYFERIGATKNGIKLETNSDDGGRYHSQWLSMMYPRLFLAKQLLRDDGVIFISIDDNEQHHLKMLMNEVFGEDNFVACLPVVMNLKGNADAYGFSDTHEYSLVYVKNNTKGVLNYFDIEEEEIESEWSKDEYGLYKQADGLRRTGQDSSRERRPKGWFPVFITKDGNIYVTDNDRPGNNEDYMLYPVNKDKEELSWSWGKRKITEEPYNLIVLNNKSIYKKQRPKLGDIPTKKPKSIFYKPEYSTSTATTKLKQLLNKKVFEGTKPIPFLKDLILIGSSKNDIVLDFFAGSATTGHAVMDLNKKGNGDGDRKFILVQIPEVTDEKSEAYKAGYKTISDISKDRLRKAIEKNDYKDGFKVFSLAPTNYNIAKDYDGDDEQELLQQEISFTEQPLIDNFEPINLVYEIILKQGFSLNSKIKQQDDFYIVKDTELERKLVITLANTVDTNTIEALKLTIDDILVCLDTALTDTQKVNFSRNFNLRVI